MVPFAAELVGERRIAQPAVRRLHNTDRLDRGQQQRVECGLDLLRRALSGFSTSKRRSISLISMGMFLFSSGTAPAPFPSSFRRYPPTRGAGGPEQLRASIPVQDDGPGSRRQRLSVSVSGLLDLRAGFLPLRLSLSTFHLHAASCDAILRHNDWDTEPEVKTMGLAQYADDGLFSPRKIAAALRTTSEEIARTAGLGKDAIQRKDRIRSDKTQRRLREMTEIVNKIEPRFGSVLMAYAWYRSEPLPGFSGQTAMQLVRDGHADDVLDYIDAVDAGIHA